MADEIGKLATATVDNSKEISGQIGKIISDISSSMMIMDDTRKSIEHIFTGIDMISGKVNAVAREMESLGNAIALIVNQSKLLDELTGMIAVSTGEHKRSMEVRINPDLKYIINRLAAKLLIIIGICPPAAINSGGKYC